MGLDDRKKIHLICTYSSFEKNFRHFTIFPHLISIFHTFSRLENCFTNFKTFSRIQDSVRALQTNRTITRNLRIIIVTCALHHKHPVLFSQLCKSQTQPHSDEDHNVDKVPLW